MLTIGQKAGNWVLEDLVSLGIPRTFRARHSDVGTKGLLKLLPLSEATKDQQKREAEALRQLRHASIPEVLDFGVDHERDLVWTVFAWFEGETLLDRLQRGPLDWKEAARILYDLASALSYMHNEGLVHRDVRPANVIVGEGRSWLAGFDFAMTQEGLERLSSAPFGDLGYLAPEVLRDPLHHGSKADVYAFGCLSFEMLTGRAAFPAAVWGERADHATRMLEWKARSNALDPGAPAPEWLRSMIGKCSDPDPDRRLPDLESLTGWLDAARPSWALALAELSEEPELEPVTAEVPMPRPTAPLFVPAPSIVRPSDASARDGVTPRRPVAPAAPPPPPPSMPASLQYVMAALLGCLSAFGFSAVLILFVEMSNGTL
ncbi:MAG: serine/threonine protein kinase [Myxococcales bacterium]|nr:serine/threonine protein kinase [Myxococcales bacterium]